MFSKLISFAQILLIFINIIISKIEKIPKARPSFSSIKKLWSSLLSSIFLNFGKYIKNLHIFTMAYLFIFLNEF